MSEDGVAGLAGGLRQRKRIAAMHRIQSAALDLFDVRGYQAVTVEQIAEASEVSPSSIYRYFGTKEDIVLWDDFDPLLGEALPEELRDGSPLLAVRRLMGVVLGQLVGDDEERIRRRMRHVMSDATLEASMARQMYTASEALGGILAAQLDRPVEDLEVQVLSHVIVGALLGGVHHWHGSGFSEPLLQVLERSFDILEAGLSTTAGTAGRSTAVQRG